MSDLERALQIMLHAHAGQTDKGGQPYIFHPIRVMLRLASVDERIVALLHDVVEDSSATLSSLEENGFSKEVVSAVECLTKRECETYEEFIRRISSNSLATKVKIEDIRDNLDVTRLPNLNDDDISRIQKYHKALAFLVGSNSKRNPC